jgi:hypothetical protein
MRLRADEFRVAAVEGVRFPARPDTEREGTVGEQLPVQRDRLGAVEEAAGLAGACGCRVRYR